MNKLILLVAVVVSFSGLALVAQEKIASKPAKKEAASSATASQHKFLAPSELTWGDAPPGLPPGAKMAVLDGDPAKKGSFTVRLQTSSGYKVPPHTHPTAECVTVISGTLHLGMGEKFDEAAGREMGPGSFAVLPARMAHFAWSTDEAVIQIHSEGPFEIKYINSADDPRTTKK